MPESVLAASNLPSGSHPHTGADAAGVSDDPFASPASPLPTPPKPCAYPPPQHSSPPGSVAAAGAAGHISTRHDRSRPPVASLSHKPTSVSSAGESTLITPMSSMDLEKVRQEHQRERESQIVPKRSSRESKRDSKRSRHSRDPEKAMHSGHNSPNRSGHHNTNLTYDDDDEDEELDEGRQQQEDKAIKILFFMAGPCVALSAVNTLWAFIALIITALTQPIRLCARRPTFGQQLAGLLGPTLNLQLRCVYTPLPPHANEDGSYHNVMLFIVHLLSPFLAMAMMFASWVLAVYWLCSGVVGDPAGQDKRDDGKETVLGLRNWWERWLMKGMKEE